MTKAIGYIRVGSDEQTQSSLAPAAQDVLLRAYAERAGLSLVAVMVDKAHETTPLAYRSQGAHLLDIIRSKDVEAVLALNPERLFRDEVEAASYAKEWRGLGVEVITLEPSSKRPLRLRERAVLRALRALNRHGLTREAV